MLQQYDKYGCDDHERWSCLMKRSSQLLLNAGSEFLRGYDLLHLDEDRIPKFEDINDSIQPVTGWRYEAARDSQDIPGFFEALSKKVFLSSVEVRPWEELDFCKLPDIFHDVFGHAALLTSPVFSDFLAELGKIGVHYREDKNALRFLSAIYWYTAEVGLIYEENVLKYYGGSIISSLSEIQTVNDPASNKIPFSITAAGNTSYDSYHVNSCYFVINDLTELISCIPEITRMLHNARRPEHHNVITNI